jgi:hypothetical protein
MNGRSEVVTMVENESGKILSTFGRPGHQAGNFSFPRESLHRRNRHRPETAKVKTVE